VTRNDVIVLLIHLGFRACPNSNTTHNRVVGGSNPPAATSAEFQFNSA